MDNWSEIKSKILFSYMGCDWISVQVTETVIERIKEVLNDTVSLIQNDTIFSFEIENVPIYFYSKSTHHFDFDPKGIVGLNQWNLFLDFLKHFQRNSIPKYYFDRKIVTMKVKNQFWFELVEIIYFIIWH